MEKGEPVSDHVQREPDTLQINGIISNASVRASLERCLTEWRMA
ncbi:phage baseplate protein [Leminorella grimontii]